MRIHLRAAEANTDNCERSLMAAARGISQMWDDVQRIKGDRKRAIKRLETT
ncbi:hypothetical protein Geu3261_0301_002 [Komagataeibacter europaeus NBRC 3261]|uniref:Uncharacterized protein n=1 Tax=Komagataeibacter europaeus NBRC 3261 TaxID=1234669 RepID=A0A0D6Q360_KOMEU|nr:hypothetical protein Geu3261_0301_002 [Komagataeibacter europaeus NBRC 3261]